MRRAHPVTLGVVALLAATLAACGGADGGSAEDPGSSAKVADVTDVAETTFTATEVEGYDLVEGTVVQVAFEGDIMAVRGGCNTMTGAFSLTDGLLAWTAPPATTMMGCPEDLAAQDTWLSDLFTDGVTAEVDDTALVVSADEVRLRLEPVETGPDSTSGES